MSKAGSGEVGEGPGRPRTDSLFPKMAQTRKICLAQTPYFFKGIYSLGYLKMLKSRADCDAPCFEQLKAAHLGASSKQQALLDVLLQLIKTWPLTIGRFIVYL